VVVSRNVLPFQPPKSMRVPAASVTVEVGVPGAAHNGNVPITVSSNATALYVTLTTLAAGRFSNNVFLLGTPTEQQSGNGVAMAAGVPFTAVVSFEPWGFFGPAQLALLKSSLRVDHLAENL
jgi:hypothetical protein